MEKIKESITPPLEGERWLRGRVRHRLYDQQLNWIAIWLGPPGSGKSWSALRMAEILEPGFSVERVAFDVDSILERVWEWHLPKGSVVMLDEAGLAIDSRRWFEHANQALSYMVESFRFLGLAFLMTVPDPSFIDRIPRSLFHMGFECIRVDRGREMVVCRPYRNQVNPRMGKVYTKRPRVFRKGKGRVKMKTMRFARPSRELTDYYEIAREKYMRGFHGELLRKGREMQVQQLTMADRTKLVLDGVRQLEGDELQALRNSRGFYDADLIQIQFETTRNVARAVAKILTRDEDPPVPEKR